MAFILIVQNDGTGTQESSNYRYEARVNDRVLKRGTLQGFNRSRPWWCLVAQVVIQQSLRFLTREEQAAVSDLTMERAAKESK